MIDNYNRNIDYLRISVTDLCNLRCRYCMPERGVNKRDHHEILSIEEIVEITRAAAEAGIKKVRITGGEPLVRRGILDLCRGISEIEGITELAITTNGTLLEEAAEGLKNAGVDRVNISIDTLDAEKYAHMTRGGDLSKVLGGIKAAGEAGLTPLKLNAVLIGGFNDNEITDFVDLTRYQNIDVRFIELMPIGEGAPFWERGYLPNSTVLEKVPELVPAENAGKGVARMFKIPEALGRVGLINPISSHFCMECNRLRLTADGMLKPCLHSCTEIPVRGLKGAELKAAIEKAAEVKPMNRGDDLSALHPSGAGRSMNQIGG